MLSQNFRYQLESRKLTGHRQQKFQCPQCGRMKCFVRYVDTQKDFAYVADEVGKCDHQHSCGYHYKPSEYFRDNQWARETGIRIESHIRPIELPPFRPLPWEYVRRSHSPHSTFWDWLTIVAAPRIGISEETLRRVYQDYHIGATRRGNVIFWQIDSQGLVHGGHIMQYGSDGHRHGFQGWTHIPLIEQKLLPQDWQLHQCLFGEHLLPQHPEAHVCIVESEKTAILMAAYLPKHLWLATAGSGGLSPEKMKCLAGRRVTLFPDSGCYRKWKEKMQHTTGIDYNVSDKLEDLPPNTDLADLLLREL